MGFVIGTGRCGTHFLGRLLAREPEVAASHERNPLNEAFHRYCKWYELPVDHEGFLRVKEQEIANDLRRHRLSMEASAHLSLSVQELYERFDAKFLLLVRSPERVVNSYLRKGRPEGEEWYSEPFAKADPDLALGYQPCRRFHHFLGRIAPRGELFARWNRLTRVGKLAWFWSALNDAALRQLRRLPLPNWRMERIEDLDYPRYLEVAGFLGFSPALGRRSFASIAAARPAALDNVASVAAWSELEAQEFEREAASLAGQLSYETRVERLSEAAATPRPKTLRQRASSGVERLRVAAIEALGGQAFPS